MGQAKRKSVEETEETIRNGKRIVQFKEEHMILQGIKNIRRV